MLVIAFLSVLTIYAPRRFRSSLVSPSSVPNTPQRGFDLIVPLGIDGEGAYRGEVSSNLVRLVAVPKMEKALEDSSVQPLARLASSTVRTFELIYRDGRTDVFLSAETVEEMRRYAGLLAMVYGGLKFQSGEPCPVYLRGLA